ncbi:MAG TPA: hypothetical protein VF060_16445 [Trebonia sp.]
MSPLTGQLAAGGRVPGEARVAAAARPAARAAAQSAAARETEVVIVLQDLEAIAPSVIVCAAFLVGVIALVRRELAPRRRARQESRPDREEVVQREEREHTEL